MKIENDFLDLITYKNNLNEAQLKIFKNQFRWKNWKKIALEQDISKNDMNFTYAFKEWFFLTKNH